MMSAIRQQFVLMDGGPQQAKEDSKKNAKREAVGGSKDYSSFDKEEKKGFFANLFNFNKGYDA